MPDASAAPEVPQGLRYTSDRTAGIRRLRVGGGFRYVDATGNAVRDAASLARIRALAIPPAYEDVWICPDPRGHLQATGRDARGRKQYRYHVHWRQTRDLGKFERLYDFGRRLPSLRRQLKAALKLPGLPRDKVLAAVVSLLDRTLIRVGNAEYARANKSFGLTTLRNRHVEFLPRGRVLFSFRGKGGQDHSIEVDDARLTRIVRRCQALPGQPLFQYIDDEGGNQGVDSGMVNDYLRAAMSGDFTAKDFRTWGGTLRAIVRMAVIECPQGSERRRAACIAQTVREVADELRNTPAVCRNSYIHPAVFEAWRAGTLRQPPAFGGKPGRRLAERFALKFLRAQRRRGAPPAASAGLNRLNPL